MTVSLVELNDISTTVIWMCSMWRHDARIAR